MVFALRLRREGTILLPKTKTADTLHTSLIGAGAVDSPPMLRSTPAIVNNAILRNRIA